MSYASAFLLLALLLLIGNRVDGEHIAWMAPYRDAENISCCDKADCLAKEVLVWSAERGEVSIDGILLTIPAGSLHRIPPDAHEPDAQGFWCYKGAPLPITAAGTRCVFYQTPYW